MIDVSELMTDPDFAQPYSLRRTAAGTYANEGEWQRGPLTTLPRVGVIQPASQDDQIKFVPEGERGENAIRVWDAEEIYISDGAGQQSDIILFNGNTYRAAARRPWGGNGYFFVIAVEFK